MFVGYLTSILFQFQSVPEKPDKIREESRTSGGGGDFRGFLQILKESGLLKDGALETLEKSLGNSDNNSEDLFETGERESRRTTSLGRGFRLANAVSIHDREGSHHRGHEFWRWLRSNFWIVVRSPLL